MLPRRRRGHDERGSTGGGPDEEPVLRFVPRVQLVATDERQRSEGSSTDP